MTKFIKPPILSFWANYSSRKLGWHEIESFIPNWVSPAYFFIFPHTCPNVMRSNNSLHPTDILVLAKHIHFDIWFIALPYCLSCVNLGYTTGELLVQGQHKRRKDETIYDFIFWWKDKSRENIIEIESTTVYWIET